jgi:hypothetical protein
LVRRAVDLANLNGGERVRVCQGIRASRPRCRVLAGSSFFRARAPTRSPGGGGLMNHHHGSKDATASLPSKLDVSIYTQLELETFACPRGLNVLTIYPAPVSSSANLPDELPCLSSQLWPQCLCKLIPAPQACSHPCFCRNEMRPRQPSALTFCRKGKDVF